VSARAGTGAGVGPDPIQAVDAALATVVQALDGASADLVVLFLGAAYAQVADAVHRRITAALDLGVLIGVTAQGVVSDGAELEQAESLSLWAAHLPGAVLTPLRYPAPAAGPEGDVGAEWPDLPQDCTAVVAFADPFSFPAAALLRWAGQSHPGVPISGGLASGARGPGDARLLLGDVLHRDGAVAVALGGDVSLHHLVSQGCRPVGPALVITEAEGNVIKALAGEPAAERIRAIFDEADAEDKALMRQGLHVGLVIDEYADEHERGDFLVRGVIGAAPSTGAVAVGDVVRVGQTVRFHVRDARSADEDLRALLAGLEGPPPTGALLFTCNGRGTHLFGEPHHDAALVSSALEGAPVAGYFAAGELGPVGSGSFLHGFTASLVLIDGHAVHTIETPS
jgi:small ligand-binding sensory domain FIST